MPRPTHAIAVILRAVGDLPESVMLHEWGSEDEMMDKLTDPNLPRQYCRHLNPDRAGYQLIPVTPEMIVAELARREQDAADQRAHSWAM